MSEAFALRVLGLIPARAGSKGVPGKNIRELAGRPLLAYAIEAARLSGVVSRIVVSTDSSSIAAVAAQFGAEVPFLRPPELATDVTPMLSVVQHAVAEFEARGWSAEVIVLLQPTQPLRRAEHVRLSVEMLQREPCDSVVSVVPIPSHFAPHYAMAIRDGRLEPYLPNGARYTRRQDVPTAYYRDGTVYALRRHVLEAGSLYGSTARPLVISSDETITIDCWDDWHKAEALLHRMMPTERPAEA